MHSHPAIMVTYHIREQHGHNMELKVKDTRAGDAAAPRPAPLTKNLLQNISIDMLPNCHLFRHRHPRLSGDVDPPWCRPTGGRAGPARPQNRRAGTGAASLKFQVQGDRCGHASRARERARSGRSRGPGAGAYRSGRAAGPDGHARRRPRAPGCITRWSCRRRPRAHPVSTRAGRMRDAYLRSRSPAR